VRAITDYLGNLPPGASFTIPGLPAPVTIEQVQAGALDFLCASPATSDACLIIDAVKQVADLPRPIVSMPEPFAQVAVVDGPPYSEPAPTEYQSLYFVRAENAQGRLSRPSNFVGGPSKAAAQPLDVTPPVIMPTVSPSPNGEGWNNGPVTVTWAASDPETNIIGARLRPPPRVRRRSP
jgi:hypothetical protein